MRAKATGVVIAGRRKEKLDETARALNELSGGATKILAVPTDLLVEDQVKNLFEQVVKTFGRPADVVVTNAGNVSPLTPLAEEAVSTWWSIIVRWCPVFPASLLPLTKTAGNQLPGLAQHRSGVDQEPA